MELSDPTALGLISAIILTIVVLVSGHRDFERRRKKTDAKIKEALRDQEEDQT